MIKPGQGRAGLFYQSLALEFSSALISSRGGSRPINRCAVRRARLASEAAEYQPTRVPSTIAKTTRVVATTIPRRKLRSSHPARAGNGKSRCISGVGPGRPIENRMHKDLSKLAGQAVDPFRNDLATVPLG